MTCHLRRQHYVIHIMLNIHIYVERRRAIERERDLLRTMPCDAALSVYICSCCTLFVRAGERRQPGTVP